MTPSSSDLPRRPPTSLKVELGERAYEIGRIERKAKGDPPILFDPGFLPRKPDAGL